MKPDVYRGPPPSEGQFREFLTRLLKVPKGEIDEREKARKRGLADSGNGKLKPD